MVVAQGQRAAVQPRHRLDDAEPESDPAGTAGGAAAIEALGDRRFLGVVDAGPVIGDDDLDPALAGTARRDRDGAVARRVFRRVVDEVADRLGEQERIAADRQPLRHIDGKGGALLLDQRPVELGDLGGDLGQLDGAEPRAAHAGIDLGEAQQRVEDADQPIDIGDRLIDLVERRLGRRAVADDAFEPRAQFGERGAQVVRDGVRGVAHAVDQALDLAQHQIDGLGELVELVAGIARRQAARQIALDDCGGGAVDDLDPAQHRAAHQDAAENGDDEGAGRGPGEAVEDQRADFGAVLDVAPDQEMEPPGQRGDFELHQPRLFVQAQHPLIPAGLDRHILGPARQVAGDRPQVRAGEQVHRTAVRRTRQPLADRLSRPRGAAKAQIVLDAADVGADHRRGLAVEIVGGAPPHQPDQQQRGGDEQGGKSERQAHRGRAPQPKHPARAGSRRRARCAAGSRRTRRRSSAAGG